MVADVFLVAWRRFHDVPAHRDEAIPWLLGVARHALQNNQRGRRRHDALAVRLAMAPLLGAVQEADDLIARRVDLAAAWPRLSATHQEAIVLIAWDDLTAVQAAEVVGITAVAFRLRLSRARRTLRHHLRELPTAHPTDDTSPQGARRIR